MTLKILNQQLKHLKILKDASRDVSIESCKLALEFTNKGLNANRCVALSDKLNSTTENVELLINALVLLAIQSIKVDVSRNDFDSSMNVMFSTEQISIFWEFIERQKKFIENILKYYNVTDLRYRDLEWRVEARISSRCLVSQVMPIITIKLFLDSEEICENKEKLILKATNLVSDNDNNVAGIDVGGETTSKQQFKQILFQTDVTNLMYVINVLELALEESKTHRAKKYVTDLKKVTIPRTN